MPENWKERERERERKRERESKRERERERERERKWTTGVPRRFHRINGKTISPERGGAVRSTQFCTLLDVLYVLVPSVLSETTRKGMIPIYKSPPLSLRS